MEFEVPQAVDLIMRGSFEVTKFHAPEGRQIAFRFDERAFSSIWHGVLISAVMPEDANSNAAADVQA